MFAKVLIHNLFDSEIHNYQCEFTNPKDQFERLKWDFNKPNWKSDETENKYLHFTSTHQFDQLQQSEACK